MGPLPSLEDLFYEEPREKKYRVQSPARPDKRRDEPPRVIATARKAPFPKRPLHLDRVGLVAEIDRRVNRLVKEAARSRRHPARAARNTHSCRARTLVAAGSRELDSRDRLSLRGIQDRSDQPDQRARGH